MTRLEKLCIIKQYCDKDVVTETAKLRTTK